LRFSRLLRFALVGVANTGVYFAWYLVLGTALPYMYAHLCATFLAMVSSYFLNCYVTFRRPPSFRTFLLFPLSNVANVLITTAGLPIAVHLCGLPESVAPLPVALAAIPLTYLVARAVMAGRSGPASPVPAVNGPAQGAAARRYVSA
jgi:putative flippase GtrA